MLKLVKQSLCALIAVSFVLTITPCWAKNCVSQEAQVLRLEKQLASLATKMERIDLMEAKVREKNATSLERRVGKLNLQVAKADEVLSQSCDGLEERELARCERAHARAQKKKDRALDRIAKSEERLAGALEKALARIAKKRERTQKRIDLFNERLAEVQSALAECSAEE